MRDTAIVLILSAIWVAVFSIYGALAPLLIVGVISVILFPVG